MASTAMNIPHIQFVPMRQPMRSEYLMSARRDDHVFPARMSAMDQPKNYMLKRDLPNLTSLSIRSNSPQRSDSSSGSGSEANSPQKINSSRYKTELCRPFEEQGCCKYAEKCQFAHGIHELRNLARHPKYKTELCRTYHTVGFCPYGPRCHFVHEEEVKAHRSPKTSPSKPARVPLEQVANSRAFRNLFASFEYSNFPTQLSVSLGSAGEYSPANSLSTSPVLSPAFSEDLQSHLSPVWPLNSLHDRVNVRRPQPVLCEHLESSIQLFQPSVNEPFPLSCPAPLYATDNRISPEQIGAMDTSVLCSDDRLPIFRRLSVEDKA